LWIFSLFEKIITKLQKIHPKKEKTLMKNIMIMMIKVSIPNIDWRGRRNFWKCKKHSIEHPTHNYITS
jgi:hypothetical protein